MIGGDVAQVQRIPCNWPQGMPFIALPLAASLPDNVELMGHVAQVQRIPCFWLLGLPSAMLFVATFCFEVLGSCGPSAAYTVLLASGAALCNALCGELSF
jgi:hypothetical protein